MSALILLDDQAARILVDASRLQKVFSVFDSIMSTASEEVPHHHHHHSGSTPSVSYPFKGHVLVTFTTLLLQFNCLEVYPNIFTNFVANLCGIIRNVNKPSDRSFRAVACECLHEIELYHPGEACLHPVQVMFVWYFTF
jgi:hypothetical protein